MADGGGLASKSINLSYSDGNAFEIEFITAEGKTIAVLTLNVNDIRLMSNKEILHVREFAGQSA